VASLPELSSHLFLRGANAISDGPLLGPPITDRSLQRRARARTAPAEPAILFVPLTGRPPSAVVVVCVLALTIRGGHLRTQTLRPLSAPLASSRPIPSCDRRRLATSLSEPRSPPVAPLRVLTGSASTTQHRAYFAKIATPQPATFCVSCPRHAPHTPPAFPYRVIFPAFSLAAISRFPYTALIVCCVIHSPPF